MPLASAMDKGQLNSRYSRVCLLVSWALFFWICMMCFNFVLFGGNRVVVDVSPESEEPYPINFGSRFDSEISEMEFDNVNSGDKFPIQVKNPDSKFSPNVDKPMPKPDPKPKPDQETKKKSYPFMRALRTVENKSDPCGGRYVYVYDLPSMFNEDMIKNCAALNLWTNMCKFVTNGALGPPLENSDGVFSKTGWYATNQFALDVIFANRMKQYECLTNDSSVAAAIFVPFYAGLEIARHLWGYHNVSTRDATSLALVDWMVKRPEWSIMGGRDHFFVGGRITWDFRRITDEEWDWGSKLLLLPAVKNMSMLVVESSPWSSNDYAIPYPTYFHPAKDGDVINWQGRMRKLKRKHLFCFAGAPRPGNAKSIRDQIMDQCKNSKACNLLGCDTNGGPGKCQSPSYIMKMFQSSIFCLQPQGDSFTRRSTFDAILAGCIPVFFHPGSAYAQYVWHLPKDYTRYSVLIPEGDVRKNLSIEQRLRQIPVKKVKEMRDVVINLIPKVIYANPGAQLETLKDAFDVSVESVINKITKLRKDIIVGSRENRIEAMNWKYDVVGEEGQVWRPHEWDPFFSKPKEEKSVQRQDS